MVARKSQLCAVMKNDSIFAMKPRLKLLNAIEANNRRAVDPDKFFRIEFGFETADRFAKQVSFFAAVNRDVISFGLNPIDFLGIEKVNAAPTLYHQSFQILIPRFELLEQCQNA